MSTLIPPAEIAARAADFDRAIMGDATGNLSTAEIEIAQRTREVANAYERALSVTRVSRQRVLTALTGEDSAAILRAIDGYTIASVVLWHAAELVCDVEDLPADGEAEGITWRVQMIVEDSPAQAGARIADDFFCGCGQRGYRGLCPSCQRAANEAGR